MADLSFSAEVDRLLLALSGKGPRGQRVFPPKVTKADLRISESESLHRWFVRCANACTDGGEIADWQIADDLAVFAVVEWREPERLSACSVIALKTEVDLESYFLEGQGEARYFRLDYDYGTLGPIFTHALPHLHAWPSDSAPRFALEGESENIVVDFLEWLFRLFYHSEWLEWADAVCRPDFSTRYGAESNPLDLIFRAFRQSQISTLRGYRKEVARIKELLRERKARLFDLRASAPDRELMAYP